MPTVAPGSRLSSTGLHGNTLTSDGTLNGTIASFDCKTLVYYIDNAIAPGDRLTYTLVRQ